jgi:hypothetical protein
MRKNSPPVNLTSAAAELSADAGSVRYKDHVRVRGIPVVVDALRIENKTFVVGGRLLRTARLKDEWSADVVDPAQTVRVIRDSGVGVDLLTFWQRLPESRPKYDYYHETEHLAAIPITDYHRWWSHQINSKTRNMIRKSAKLGVNIEETLFDEPLVAGISRIFNQSPVRRGKKFWHYGKPLDVVRAEMGEDLPNSIFIGAYYQGDLIAFLKLLLTDRGAVVMMLLDLMEHRDKSPMNGMIAKAVEVLASREIRFLTYVPRYYIPLSTKGSLAVRFRTHRGVRGLVPDAVMAHLLNARAKWYCGKKPY